MIENDLLYEGDFLDGKKNGHGVLTWINNKDYDKYIGQFRNNSFHGEGELLFKDGRKREGTFNNGKKNGTFIITYPDGKQKRELWENGVIKTKEKMMRVSE